MITLIGHGYVGQTIASELEAQGIPFSWQSHRTFTPTDRPVINAAGFTGSPNVDACEVAKGDTIRGNIAWPLRLARMCEGPLVHISSGCIYQGDNSGQGWRETDAPNFDGSLYSLTKQIAEEELSRSEGAYILRIRMPFGAAQHPRNLLTKLAAYPKLVDSVNSLSRIEDAAKVAIWVALYRPEPGIYNVCNPGAISVREIADMMGLKKVWFSSDEFKAATTAPRSTCILNTEKISGVFPLPDIRVSIAECLRSRQKKAAA